MRDAFGDNLRSVILYGSAAGGDFHEGHSDLNVLYVLGRVGLEELEASKPIAEWWRKGKHPSPLIFAQDEIRRSTDAFPIEFLDLAENHRVLHGEDVAANLEIPPLHHRAQVEHELRAKLLKLRQRYALIHHDRKAVVALMVDALSSFAALFRHAVRAAGNPCGLGKAETFAAAARQFQLDARPFLEILEVRAGTRQAKDLDARRTFQSYLDGVARMAAAVDGLLVK